MSLVDNHSRCCFGLKVMLFTCPIRARLGCATSQNNSVRPAADDVCGKTGSASLSTPPPPNYVSTIIDKMVRRMSGSISGYSNWNSSCCWQGDVRPVVRRGLVNEARKCVLSCVEGQRGKLIAELT